MNGEDVNEIQHTRRSENTATSSGRYLWPAVLLLLGALFLLGYLPRRQQRTALLDKAAAHGVHVPSVSWRKPELVEASRELTLPGNIQGLEEAVIYARADGYLARLHVDLGDRVTEGQVLAELDTPEAAQELAQARETLAQADANLLRAQAKRDNTVANLKRYLALGNGLTSREELDLKRTQARLDEADVHVAEAARNAQRASMARLKLQQSFALVRAPFAGTVTARTVERGNLVSARGGSPLFKVTALQTLRIFVQVPQSRVAGVRRDLPARITLPEYPNRTFAGTVTHVADALDASSRTMAVEVQVPNPERTLLPGMYSNVTLTLSDAPRALTVPASALIIGEHGVHIAQLTKDGHAHFTPVVIARDRGSDIELESGLTGDEQIIVNPGPALHDGGEVKATPLLTTALKH